VAASSEHARSARDVLDDSTKRNLHETRRSWRAREGRPTAAIQRGDRNRFFLDPARVTGVSISHAGLKMTFHDRIYVGMSGG